MTLQLRHLFAALALFAGLAAAPGSAHAAESYDNCTGFIDSLPTTITTQGVWCLDKNLATAINSGDAIVIGTNNVTIDCNDFKIGGLAAGENTDTYGITALNKQNAVVRNCNIRGFYIGLNFHRGAGHLIEDNRFDNNLTRGISVRQTDNSVVQRNRVYDTGGRPGSSVAYGIQASADVIDNTVAGVFADGANANPVAIWILSASAVRNNRVRGLQVSGTGVASGIRVSVDGAGSMIDGNHVMGGNPDIPGAAISGGSDPVSHVVACSNNVTAGFYNPMHACINAGGNTHISF